LTEEEIEEDEDDALLTTLALGGEIEGREAHHTEAQIVRFPCPTFDRWIKNLMYTGCEESQGGEGWTKR
jgi:hypothetical protein